jgi:hypothetical protein
MIASLINGLDITLIEPGLFGLINPYLEPQITRLQEAKEHFSVDRLVYVRRYINEEYPDEQERLRILTLHPKPVSPKPRPFRPEELNRQVELVLSGRRSKEYSQIEIDAILDELKQRREAAIEEEDYIEAERIADSCKQLLRQAESVTVSKIQEEKSEMLTSKLEEARAHLAELEYRWETVMANFQAHREYDLREMSDRNAARVAKLEEQKVRPPPPRLQKYSPRLLNLRRRELAMVSSKRYDDAAVLQEEAEVMQRDEDEHIQQLWVADVDGQAQKLIKKQKKEYEVRQVNLAKEERTMIRQRKQELTAARRKVEHLEWAIKGCQPSPIETSEPTVQLNEAGLPVLNLSALNRIEEPSPKTFKKRRLINMKVYTRLPPKSQRVVVRYYL